MVHEFSKSWRFSHVKHQYIYFVHLQIFFLDFQFLHIWVPPLCTCFQVHTDFILVLIFWLTTSDTNSTVINLLSLSSLSPAQAFMFWISFTLVLAPIHFPVVLIHFLTYSKSLSLVPIHVLYCLFSNFLICSFLLSRRFYPLSHLFIFIFSLVLVHIVLVIFLLVTNNLFTSSCSLFHMFLFTFLPVPVHLFNSSYLQSHRLLHPHV